MSGQKSPCRSWLAVPLTGATVGAVGMHSRSRDRGTLQLPAQVLADELRPPARVELLDHFEAAAAVVVRRLDLLPRQLSTSAPLATKRIEPTSRSAVRRSFSKSPSVRCVFSPKSTWSRSTGVCSAAWTFERPRQTLRLPRG